MNLALVTFRERGEIFHAVTTDNHIIGFCKLPGDFEAIQNFLLKTPKRMQQAITETAMTLKLDEFIP